VVAEIAQAGVAFATKEGAQHREHVTMIDAQPFERPAATKHAEPVLALDHQVVLFARDPILVQKLSATVRFNKLRVVCEPTPDAGVDLRPVGGGPCLVACFDFGPIVRVARISFLVIAHVEASALPLSAGFMHQIRMSSWWRASWVVMPYFLKKASNVIAI